MKRPAALQIPALLAISLAAIATAAIGQAPAARSTSVQSASYGNLPLGFEANQGQTDPSVQFLVHGQGYTLFLRPGEAVLALNPTGGQSEAGVVSMKLLGANFKAATSPEDKQITRTNYFLGSNPARWRTDIPNYSRVRYRSVYDGIDLVYYGNQRRLEHDFVVAPNADPSQIVFSLDGAQSAHIDPATGDLVLSASPGKGHAILRLLKPIAYQESNGHRTPVSSSYKLLAQNKIAFSVAAYERTRPLIIDPVLTYSTYLGGTGSNGNGDQGNGIALDSTGNAYVVGTAYSTNFPVTPISFQNQDPAPASTSTVFVTKLNPAGTALVYSTYFGGTGGDAGYGIALDSANNAYITGATYSTDFPVTCDAFQTTNPSTTEGATTGFVAKLNATGNALVYSTYLGGTGNDASPAHGDVAQAIAVDPTGNAYVTGYTFSSNFPVTDAAFQTDFKGSATSSNVFATKLNPLGTALLYSTFLGGSGGDYGNAIAIDASGDAYVTGSTGSSNFPVTSGAFQPALGGSSNAFVTELNPAGEEEVYSTYLGGNSADSAQAIAVDQNGFTYVAGNTSSSNFPLTSGVLEGPNSGIGGLVGPNGVGTLGAGDVNGAFMTKLSVGGSALEYSTYLEGLGTSVTGLAVDGTGTAYITGSAFPEYSTPFIGYYGQFQPTPDALSEPGGGPSAFVVKLNPSATALNYATLLGGSSNDGATALALDGAGNVYITGFANSTDFPTTAGAFQNFIGTARGSLIPTTLTVISESMNCDPPGDVVNVNLMVNSNGNTQAPTGTVSFTGSFNVGEYAIPVVPGANGTATVAVNGNDSIGYFSGATWEAVYSGDSTYAPSSLSGSVDCSASPQASKSTVNSDASTIRKVFSGQPSGQKIIPRQALHSNILSASAASPRPQNLSTATGANAFISKFALAAEANQTPYSGISSVGLPTSLSINYEMLAPGLSWALFVSVSLNSATPGPPPTGTVTFFNFGVGIANVPVSGSSTGVSSVPAWAVYGIENPSPIGWTAVYSGDANYQSSVVSGIAPLPPCYPDCSDWRSVRTGHTKPLNSTSVRAVEVNANSASSTSTKLNISGPKFIPPPAIPQEDQQGSQAMHSAESQATSACMAPGGAGTPAFSLAAGTYTSIQTVTITDTTAGATIYYTLNGTTPSNKSAVYSRPLSITNSATLQAIAYAPGVLPSSVDSATYTLDAAAPVFNPPSGTYPGPLTVTITSVTPTAEIAYTPNGNIPSEYATYTGPITLTASGKVYALAQQTGFTRSATTEAIYMIETATATPVFSLPTGNYLNAQTVTITDTTPGAAIYYTTNGTTPTTSSTIYTGPITVSATETLEAIAVAAGFSNSAVASGTYTITPQATFGSVNIGSRATASVTVTILNAATLGSVSVLTQGAQNLDFTNAGGGSCTAGTAYAANAICTVSVTFAPKTTGTRYGAAVLYDSSGNVIATGYLQGTGSGPQVNFLPGTETTIGSGWNAPDCCTLDESGNLYIGNNGQNIKETPSAGGYVQSILNINGRSGGLVIDGAGNFYIADDGPDVYKEMPSPGGGYAESTLGSGLSQQNGAVVDGSGNVYVADALNGRVLKETLSAGNYTQSVIYTCGVVGEQSCPSSVAVDGSGNVYVTAYDASQVLELTPSAGGYTQTLIGSGLYWPSSVVVDGNGNLYIADTLNSRIVKEALSAGSYVQSTVSSSSLDWPWGAGVDWSGNVYIIDTYNNRVLKEDVSDPPSLSFAATPQNSTSSDSPKIVTIVNNGNAPLNISAVSYPADFPEAASATGDCKADTSLPANGTCTLTIDFTPVLTPGSSTSLSESVILTTNTLNATATEQAIVVTGTGTIPQAATPVLSPGAGAYTSAQSVTITDSTTGVAIYYTTNGTTPTTSSTVYTGPITVSTTETIEAIAVATGYVNSAIASVTYSFPPQAATPTFSPAAGAYTSAQSVTVADATPGATIYYTTNGTAPSISSTVYTSPITVRATETLEAIAVATGYINSAVTSATYTIQPSTTAELQFVPIVPCRIADTRNPAGLFGGPELAGNASRTFDIPQSACNIPATASAYSLNVTVVPNLSIGYLTVWPAGQSKPNVSTLNSDGRVKANAAIVQAGTNGGVSVYTSDPTQVILDIDGYFVPAGVSASGMEFYPLTPCRIADTRNPTGTLGGPFLAANTSRDFPVLSSTCNIPPAAKAYSLNVTAVPHGPLGYLTAWPSGQPQPATSTLNSSTGAVAANAAIVSAGTGDVSGDVAVYASDDTDVILDINGYFAPPATGGLSFYTATPCRVLDTRSSSGPFDGILTVPVQASACAPPATAQAYILNATALPVAALGYMTFWAAGAAQPGVSTLNASDGAITSNMVIVAPGQGAIDAYSSNATNLLLDLSGYFAP